MTRLSRAEQCVLVDGLRELYAQTDITRLRETLVRVAARLVPCDIGSYNEIDRAGTKPLVALRFPEWDEAAKYLPAFAAHYSGHPIARYIHETGDRQALRLSDFVTSQQLRELSIYNEYYKPMGIRHQIVFFFDSDGAPAQRAISLNRSGRDFSERDRTILELLRPHFRQAYENARSMTELRFAAQAMEHVQAASTKAMLLASGAGRIEWVSALGRGWLREFCGIEADPEAVLPEPIGAWLDEQRDFRRSLDGAARTLALRLSSAHRILSIELAAEDDEDNATLVLALDTPGPAATIVCLPGLTPRENEVLGWIAQGKTNPEIAIILGLSVRTVYKHVENLFAKLGVGNRAEAMLQALDYAPVSSRAV
jgi:DNA-binding CsgD family transcriptional regulator